MAVRPVTLSSTSRFTVVLGSDWTGIYLDGELVEQGHSVSARQLAEALGYSVAEVELPISYEDDGLPLPEALADLGSA
jgi:hypothetical protein